MKKTSNFQIAKVRPQCVASVCCLAFAYFVAKFQPVVVYQSVAYKKRCVYRRLNVENTDAEVVQICQKRLKIRKTWYEIYIN